MSDGRAFQADGTTMGNPREPKESLWVGTVSVLDWLKRKPERGV